MSELNIPDSWAEINWDDIIEIQGGSQPPKSIFSDKPKNGFIRLLQIRDFASDKDAVYIPLEKANKICEEDDVLIGRYGASIGRICTGKSGAYNVALAKVIYPKDSIIKPFLEYHLRAPEFQRFITNIGGRAAQAGFNKEDLSSLPFPLPPVLEQERIVQKIESCFSKIEETEQNLNKVEVLLEKYRESLLAKAFRGELILQNPDDEPASVLLAKIREERAQNQKGKKKEQEFAPISDDEKPFDVPENWEWVRLGEICSQITDGEHQTPQRLPEGEMLLSAKNIRDGFIDYSNYECISKHDFDKALNRCMAVPGDILMVSVGATIGRCSIVVEDKKFALVRSVALIRPLIDSEYLKFCFKTYDLQNQINDSKKSTGQPCLYLNAISNLKIPLPSLKIQRNIVSVLNMKLDELEHIKSSLNKKTKLLSVAKNSILNKAFEGRLVEQIESEGTGHELLQKILEQKNQEVIEKENTKKKVTKKVSKKIMTKK